MAAAAGAFVMRLRRFGLVAGEAVWAEASVIDLDHGPFLYVGVAKGAGAGQMRFGRVLAVANFAPGYPLVSIVDLCPFFRVGVAFTAEAGVVEDGCTWAVAGLAGRAGVVLVIGQRPAGCVGVAQ